MGLSAPDCQGFAEEAVLDRLLGERDIAPFLVGEAIGRGGVQLIGAVLDVAVGQERLGPRSPFAELHREQKRRPVGHRVSGLAVEAPQFRGGEELLLLRVQQSGGSIFGWDFLGNPYILTQLVERYGWEEMGNRVKIRCFQHDPSIKSSLTFLRKTPWARQKVEAWFVADLRRRG